MSIQLVTYANQTVTPTNDAIIYEKAVDQNGIFYGCNVTVTSNNVNITGGYGIVCGREFVINSESIAVTLAPSGTLEGRLYVRLDLADADAPIQLLTATGNTLPSLVQDADVNYTNGVYEMELATFDVGVSALSNVVETYDAIVGTSTAVNNAINSTMADYVVEEGTSGIWTYKKYASKTFEAWGTYAADIAVNTSAGSYGGYRSGEISAGALPVTVDGVPVIVANMTTGSQGSWVNNIRYGNGNVVFYLSAGASLSSSARGIHIIVRGEYV